MSNNDVTINISNTDNDSLVFGGIFMGGFFGSIFENNDINMTFSNSMNTGEIFGNNYVGGFIGVIGSQIG